MTANHIGVILLPVVRCGWPKGCGQYTGEDPEMCSYHAKVREGHIEADGYLFTRSSNYPPESKREGVLRLLESLGVPQGAILTATHVRMSGDHLSRHGHGKVAEGRLRMPRGSHAGAQ